MHRLFVAIRPPRPIREHLLGLMQGVADARWQDEEQLHLTLRFIGEVDGRTADDVDATLSSVRHPPFTIALSGLGAFERRGSPLALWAGVAPHDSLKALHKKVDQALVRGAGLEPERRAYLPHITLARFGRGGGPLGGMVERGAAVSSQPFEVDSFSLYESRLTPDGALYTLAARYALR
ncbi:MAG TPA: RNA 2',3'-cyclic phosphodiesterase [Allosphingosinicella sp.]|nr:RNA 2',3'-cyclic phosphodiesterase [Allosphingosinicella sp.]